MANVIPDRWAVDPFDTFCPPVANGPISTIAVQYDVYGTGGAERVTSEQLKMLVQAGYRVLLYTNAQPTENDQPIPENVLRRVPPSENLDHEERYAFWKHEVATEKIDACLYNSWVSGWMQFDCWALTGMGVRFVLYCHSMFTSWFYDDTADYLSRALPWVAKRASAVICVNEASASFFSLLGASVVLFMNPLRGYLNGVDCERDPVKGRIVWVGRMSPEKRPDDLVEILRAVRDHHPEAHMVVVGAFNDAEKPQPQTLAAASSDAGLSEYMEFTGYASPYAHYAKASVYLQTSEYEGFSLSLAEAMFFGLPCVCYGCDYQPLVADNPGVISVPTRNIAAAAEAICKVLDDPVLSSNMGRSSRQAYERVANVDLADSYCRLIAGISQGQIPQDLLFSRTDSSINEARMSMYYLQGVCLAADERHRIQWTLQGNLDRANGRIASLEDEISSLKTKVESLQSRLDAVLNSKSYRLGCAITEPYRAAKASAKKVLTKASKSTR